MAYKIDDARIGLNDLMNRINSTNLVPSRASLREDIDAKMKVFPVAIPGMHVWGIRCHGAMPRET